MVVDSMVDEFVVDDGDGANVVEAVHPVARVARYAATSAAGWWVVPNDSRVSDLAFGDDWCPR
ncbi:MAG: hypothetical protein ABSG36_02880 [Acidimicrobiales bacterium]